LYPFILGSNSYFVCVQKLFASIGHRSRVDNQHFDNGPVYKASFNEQGKGMKGKFVFIIIKICIESFTSI
jgi:hypothetical protein